jgi:hypothetical protein
LIIFLIGGQNECVEVNPKKCNGKPIIAGTRIPVTVILDQLAEVKSIPALLKRGFSVSSVSEFGFARADDSEIIEFATREKRLLITLANIK